MRRYRHDDFFNEDHRRECVHGNTKHCPECEAEADDYLARERWDAFSVRARWFIGGVMFLMVLEMLRDIWLG